MSISCQLIREPLMRRRTLPPRVGILIPAYNEATHLSALLQRCRAVRPSLVLVVDDGSTDDTARVLAAEVGRGLDGGVEVRALRNPRNLGKQGSVCRGLRPRISTQWH